MKVKDQMTLNEVMTELEKKGFMDKYKMYTSIKDYHSYFNNPLGIHGVLHAKRVLMLSLILSYYNGLDSEDTGVLIKASLYHDIGRDHDGICYEHGKNSFRKMLELGLIEPGQDEDNETLRYVIENHCIHDKKAFASVENYRINNRERAVNLLRLFKDSDGLDRVRINDLNPEYLRNTVAGKLVDLAYQLLVQTKE